MKPQSRLTLLIFAFPAILQSFMHGPAGAVLQGVYAKHVGLALTALGTAILISRVFDAITDPLIGYLSDRTFEKTGSRKPWVIGGMVISIFAVWQLYNPGPDVTPMSFTLWFVLAYLGWTMVEIPYRSWGLGLSHDYSERTRVMTWVAVGTTLGGIAFFFMPFIQQAMGIVETTEITPVTLAGTAIVVAIGLPVAVLLAAWLVPNGSGDIAETGTKLADSFGLLVKSVIQNGPLLYITGVFLFMGITAGMGGGLLYLYVDVYLGLGEQLPALLLLAGPILLLSTPLWGWACARFEKHRTLAFAVVVQSLTSLAFAFVPTGGSGFAILAPIMIINLMTQGAGLVAFPAMMGDIADYGRLKFGHDRTGTYFAFFTMAQKAIGGIGVSLGLFVAAWFGFDAMSAEQTTSGVFGMKLSMAYVPAFAALFTVPAIWFFPINKARQEEIQATLKESAKA